MPNMVWPVTLLYKHYFYVKVFKLVSQYYDHLEIVGNSLYEFFDGGYHQNVNIYLSYLSSTRLQF